MDVLYIPQLDEVDASGDTTATRYKLLAKRPESGVVGLEDKAVNKIAVTTPDALRLVMPPLVKGQVRDFFVRLVITSDAVPEVTFAAPTGEIVSFEDIDENVLSCQIGINVFSFTENDEGVFFVNRKVMDIDHSVEFDACGGVGATSSAVFKLGATYLELPRPLRTGYTFTGWYTAAEGGTRIVETDTVKSGVAKLYAQWIVYVDPFVDAICAAKNVSFASESEAPWTVDSANFRSSPGSARSGAIADNGSTVLEALVSGAGTISFWWKTSSETNYDKLRFYVDGVQHSEKSGTDADWAQVTVEVAGECVHALDWKYEKDSSRSLGEDCGWIDDVVWTPAGT